MITVHGMAVSGNCWKVAQILRFTGRPFTWVEVDSLGGETHTPAFLALNPNAKVPAVVLDDGTVLTESGAILCHFAEGTIWLPDSGLAIRSKRITLRPCDSGRSAMLRASLSKRMASLWFIRIGWRILSGFSTISREPNPLSVPRP